MSAADLGGLLRALDAVAPAAKGAGRVAMFIGARRGEGVTTLVRATIEALRGELFAVDLDLRRNGLALAYKAEGRRLGPPVEPRFGGPPFYEIVNAQGAVVRPLRRAFNFHPLEQSSAMIGAFDNRAVPDGGRVRVLNDGAYWRMIRAAGALTLVDAPALERSRVGLRVARDMDGVVLAVAADDGAAPAAMAAKAEIEAAGGRLLGIVYTRASAEAAALERMFKRAG